MQAEDVLVKSPFEKRLLDFDVSDVLDDGELVLMSPPPLITTQPAGVTIIGPAVMGGRIQAMYEGGSASTEYHVSCQYVTTSQEREACGDLWVLPC